MALLDIRQRAGYLFLAVIVGHLLLISAQVSSRRGVPILEEVTFGVFGEAQRVISSSVSAVGRVWSGYIGLRHAKIENDELKQRLATAEIELQQQRALADRTRNLADLLELREHTALRTTAAEIIGAAATPDFRTLTIDKGTHDGLRTDMAVIAPAGVVGRVVVTSLRAAKVQLLVDRNAAAGAIIERSRAQGVALGGGDERLRLDYVSETSDIMVGDAVVTSGIDGIFPKGITIGQVETVEKNGTAYKQIIVRPAVNFSNLEEVLVVLSSPNEHATKDDGPEAEANPRAGSPDPGTKRSPDRAARRPGAAAAGSAPKPAPKPAPKAGTE
jgi:rod shape-determining protein MreC